MKDILQNIITKKSRRVWHCPPHFIKVSLFDDGTVKFDDTTTQSTIRNWLYEHINNRFFIGPSVTFINGLLVNEQVVGFEDPADATYFALLRPQLLLD